MTDTLTQFTLAISATERFRAAGSSFDTSGAVPWIVLGLGVLVLGGIIAVFTLIHRRDRRREQWKLFADHAARVSLSDEETALLRNIAINAQLKNPEAVFTSETTFLRSLATVNKEAGLFGKPTMSACASCKFHRSLRVKLGYSDEESTPDESQGIGLGPIITGTTLKVIRQRAPHDAEVLLEEINDETGELTVGKRQDLAVSEGETWTLRYAEDGLFWEFAAQVTSVKSETELFLKPTGKAKDSNRRRFARVAVDRPAQIAMFPFSTQDAQAGQPQFIPARMVELAGPGLLIETTLDAKTNDRVLVVLDLAGTQIESLGVVRSEARKQGQTNVPMAVELVGLNTAQIAQLSRETNAFATGRAWRGTSQEHDAPQEQPNE